MSRATGIIVFLLVLAAAAGASVIISYDALGIDTNEKISALISISASLGALISAAFVVASYMQTNKAFVESQRPHLLIMVQSSAHITTIHYHNITNNRFADLTISVVVIADGHNYRLSHLFREKMTMIGQDRRQRSFDTFAETHRLGLDMQAMDASWNEVKLKIGYSYTFNGAKDMVEAQEYRWDPTVQQWIIC